MLVRSAWARQSMCLSLESMVKGISVLVCAARRAYAASLLSHMLASVTMSARMPVVAHSHPVEVRNMPEPHVYSAPARLLLPLRCIDPFDCNGGNIAVAPEALADVFGR